MSTKKKYIDSHWLVFALDGVIALLFGWYIMFTDQTTISVLITIAGIAMLSMGVVEICNLIHRTVQKETWGLSLAVAIVEIVAAVTLLCTMSFNPAWALTILAIYTLLRGLFEIIIGVRAVDDNTDKFIWVLCGITGAILSFVIFNSGHFETNTFLQFFGVYMTIFGLCNLIYGVHNRNQKEAYHLERSEIAKKAHKKK